MAEKSHILVGKTITEILIAEDKMALLFRTLEAGDILARCDADCCSHTWVEGVEIVDFPAEVLEVKDLNWGKRAERNDDGLIQHYGYEIVTIKGSITIDYRNESNGYYGGSLCWDDMFYGGAYRQNISKMKWREVTL